MIARYARSEDRSGWLHVLTTLIPLGLLWWAAVRLSNISPWLTVIPLIPLILVTVRVFGLMHECGHGSLFRSCPLNRAIGFLLGVLS